jgi:hypothetical protein
VKLTLYKSVADFRDPLKATGALSLPFTLPATHKNAAIFHYDNDKQKLGKFKGVYQAQLVLDNEILLNGELNLSKIKATNKGFEVYIGQTQLLSPRIGDIVTGAKLTDIQSFERLAFSGNTSVLASWNANQIYPDTEVCFPHVVRSFADLQPTQAESDNSQFQNFRPLAYHSGYESLGVSHYCAAIVRAIFADAGYTVQGDIFQNDTFQRLTMLYSNSGEQKWNYGTLAPMRSTCDQLSAGSGGFSAVFDTEVKNFIQRTPASNKSSNPDLVGVMVYYWQARSGDFCESLGEDGVYTCKYSGLYTISMEATHNYVNGADGQGGFTVLRCISDQEFLDEKQLPSQATWSQVGSTGPVQTGINDPDTLWLTNGSLATKDVYLTAGKQYQVQRYIQFDTPVAQPNYYIAVAATAGEFSIITTAGPKLLNPALFLPDMTQEVFLKGMFKLLNLYYQVDEKTKTVTLFGRDDFFQESLDELVDLSRFLNVDDMDETPFGAAELASTYLTWAPDENDYLLKGTDYLDKVNGVGLTGSTVLPFAPLGYVAVQYEVFSGSNVTHSHSNPATSRGIELVPSIIPYTDSIDSSVLTDPESVTEPGSWVPRLLLNQGNDLLAPEYHYYPGSAKATVGLGRPKYTTTTTTTPTYTSTTTTYRYPLEAFPPKLTFFNVKNQPVYEIQTNNQSFLLSGYTGATIYNPASTEFLLDVNRVPQLDLLSLATNVDGVVNPKGFYLQLYGNDLLIDSFSNYYQGVGRMNSVLWNQLTGRQVLRIGQDLYLLDSLTNFDVNAKLVTYRLYKLVGNNALTGLSQSGGTSGSTILYSSTMTATASCPTNYSGSSKTSTATRTSYVSQVDANQKAYQAALSQAQAQLVCTLQGYVGYGTATASCPGTGYGYETTASGTYVSTISQADADAQAVVVAQQNAQAQLVCYLSPIPGQAPFGTQVIRQINCDLTPQASFAAAQAVPTPQLSYKFYSTFRNSGNQPVIKRGQTLYVSTPVPPLHNLADGYYPFRYTTGGAVMAVRMQNGLVVDYIDTLNLGATA